MSQEDDVGAASVGEDAKDSRDELEDILKALEVGGANLDIALSFAPTDLCARTLNSLTCSLVKCPCESTLSRFAR